MKRQNEKENQVVRPETPKSEDPARLNNLNPDQPPKEMVGDTMPKLSPREDEQDQAADHNSPTGQERGTDNARRSPGDDKPTNPPHKANDGEVWATGEQGNAENAKA